VTEYQRAGVRLVGLLDEGYPRRLRALSDPPRVLYVRGDVAVLARERLVAIVGTREPTPSGISVAATLTGALADRGWGIVSGLAKGIDTVAHWTALKRGAPTIAVMGGGLNRVEPGENEDLASRIVGGGGALISEQPFGVRPRSQHMTARDRLQSCLSVAVVVAQSDPASGTMHTARFAAIQGRSLFCAVPARLDEDDYANAGVRVLLERPARELCSLLPAWRDDRALCARLGDRPLAHPVRGDDVDGFLRAIERARISTGQRGAGG
jgi:DNA processing protein